MSRIDGVLLHEDAELDLPDDIRAGLFERVHHDEVVVVVLVDLRSLMLVLGVLDRQRMKPELSGRETQVLTLRVGDVEPAGMLAAQLGQLVRRMVLDRVRLLDEKT